jgi:hypothetical protein
MQPNNYNTAQDKFRSRLRRMLTLGGVVVLLLIGWFIYKAGTFHITGTSPSLSNFSSDMPDLHINFSKTLSTTGMTLSDPNKIIGSSTVQDKTLTIKFNQQLVVGQRYSFAIVRIASTGGKVIQHKILTFTAKDIPYEDLSKQEQHRIVASQDPPIYDVNNIKYKGFDKLLFYSLTPDQVQNVKFDLFDYSKTVNQQFPTMEIPASSVKAKPHDRYSSSTENFIKFDVVMGGKTYRAEVSYDGLSSYVETKISLNGELVYNSEYRHD